MAMTTDLPEMFPITTSTADKSNARASTDEFPRHRQRPRSRGPLRETVDRETMC